MNARAMAGAGRDEFARIIAVRATDDDDDIALLREFDGGGLALLGRLANGVPEADLRIKKTRANELHEVAHALNGLRGLRDDAKACAWLKLLHILLSQYDIKFIEIAGH